MRLIHLTSSGGWGGREMYPAILAAAQRERGYEVSLVAKRATPLHEFLSHSDLEYDILRIGPYIDPPAAWQLARILKRRQPEIIQVHLSRDLALVSLACSVSRMHPVLILHKHIGSGASKRDILHRYLYRKLSAAVAVSNYVKRSLVASCPIEEQRVRVIYCGVNPRNFAPASGEEESRRDSLRRELGAAGRDTVLAGVLGRLEPRKGQDVFLQAASRLARRVPEMRFAVIGAPEGRYGFTLKKMAAELGIKDRVFFSGYRKDARAIYAALDILVVPSREEAFGLVAVEGMLSALAVVASDSGALPEFIADGETGLLFPAGDAQALAQRLELLAGDHSLRRELGAKARAWAEVNLSLERSLELLEELYEECLA